MRTIEFNALGQPVEPDVPSGATLLMVQGRRVSVVRLELLPPDEYGPSLDPALNDEELAEEALRAVERARPECLGDTSRDWVLECPPSLAARARFRE